MTGAINNLMHKQDKARIDSTFHPCFIFINYHNYFKHSLKYNL